MLRTEYCALEEAADRKVLRTLAKGAADLKWLHFPTNTWWRPAEVAAASPLRWLCTHRSCRSSLRPFDPHRVRQPGRIGAGSSECACRTEPLVGGRRCVYPLECHHYIGDHTGLTSQAASYVRPVCSLPSLLTQIARLLLWWDIDAIRVPSATTQAVNPFRSRLSGR